MQDSDNTNNEESREQSVENAIERSKRSMVRQTESFAIREKGREVSLAVTRLGVGPLLLEFDVSKPTSRFEFFDFEINDKWKKYSVMVRSPLDQDLRPTIFPGGPILMRVDSGCETGQLFGDVTCECQDQLVEALRRIDLAGSGVVINIPRQDGRGMGLPFKLATLGLQLELGVDTVKSGALLDPDNSRDIRTYAGVIAILKFFGVSRTTPLRVLTNNPKKLTIFGENDFSDVQAVEIVVPPTKHTRHHLVAKQEHLGHTNLIPQGK